MRHIDDIEWTARGLRKQAEEFAAAQCALTLHVVADRLGLDLDEILAAIEEARNKVDELQGWEVQDAN